MGSGEQVIRMDRNVVLGSFLYLLVASANALPKGPGFSPVAPHIDLQSSFQYNCYAASQSCIGSPGKTRAGGYGNTGCSPINAAGCTHYSFSGGGQFKLCQYSDTKCGNVLVAGPDGEGVNCASIDNPKSFRIAIRGHDC